MPVTLECAHSVKSRDFLDSEVGAFQIEGEHPVFPGAIGELALVLGREFKHRFEVPERDFLGEWPVEIESDFGGERWLNGEGVFLRSREISGEFDLAVVDDRAEVFRARADF